MKYDLIIAGGGLSGLSLLYHIRQKAALKNKKILLIDRAPKSENDRTWSFWEAKKGIFEHIIAKKWRDLRFYSANADLQLDMADFEYKMIRGIDFYTFMNDFVENDPNTSVVYGNIDEIGQKKDGDAAFVRIAETTYFADFACTSLYSPSPPQPEKHYLLQHFKGWIIETPSDFFDPEKAVLMDFRVGQEGDCRFVYVLPTDARTAMVEYTVFSADLLPEAVYDAHISDYIEQYLNIKEYACLHTEFGVIPMTNAHFEPWLSPNVLQIGTAGGNTKASTGYTYQNIQKHSAAIAKFYAEKGSLSGFKYSKNPLFEWYDSTLLRILAKKTLLAADIFTLLFQGNKAHRILAFLDNDTKIHEDIAIMSSVPLLPFLKAALKEAYLGLRKHR